MKKLYIITLICIFISCWKLLPAAVITVNQTQFANRSTHVQNQFNGVNTTINNYTTLDRAVLRRQATFAGISGTSIRIKGVAGSTIMSLTNSANYVAFSISNNPIGSLFYKGTTANPGIGSVTWFSTGFYWPVVNTLGVVVTGAEKARFSKGGLSIFGNTSSINTYASNSVQSPTIQGPSNLTVKSNPSSNGRINMGTSSYDEATNRLGIGTTSPTTPLHAVGDLFTTAKNFILKLANNLITKLNSAFITFVSRDQSGTEYDGGSIGVVFTNHSTNKQQGYLAFDLVSSAQTKGPRRKMTIDSNGVTMVNGALVIGGDYSGITFANRSTILSGYLRRYSTDTMTGINGSTNSSLNLGRQNVSQLSSMMEAPPAGSWFFANTLGGGTLQSDLGGIGALLVNPTYNMVTSGAGTSDIRISRTETKINPTYNFLLDAGINVSGTHIAVATVSNHGRAVFKGFSSSSLTGGTVTLDDRGIVLGGVATVWDDLRIEPVARTGAGIGTAPAYASSPWDALLFNYKFVNAGGEYLYFNVQMPHAWKGSDIYPHVHYVPHTTGTGAVDFSIYCSWATPVTGTFGTGSTYAVSNTIASNSQYKHLIANNATPQSMSGMALSSIAACRLTRSAADSYAGDVSVLYIDIHYEIDSMGSSLEYIK